MTQETMTLDNPSSPSKELTTPATEQNALVAAPSTSNFLAIIEKATRDPSVDIDKMHGLLDVQERMMNKQAEINFNQALGDLQDELPTITKNAEIVHKGKKISAYATYEQIDKHIRPLLKKYGFSVRFGTKKAGNVIDITSTLAHRDGHSVTDEIPLAIDTSGAKNSVQAVGSTISYGKRYLVGMQLNLVFEGEDDDAQSADFVPLPPAQIEDIKKVLNDNAATSGEIQDFLNFMGVTSYDRISATDYEKAMSALRGWAAKKAQAAKQKAEQSDFPGDRP